MSATDKLTRILKLERSQGYRNAAVIGGFESLAPAWRGEALSEARDEAQAAAVREMAALLEGYAESEPEARARTVAELLKRLGATASAPATSLPSTETPPPMHPASARPPMSEGPALPPDMAPPVRRPASGLDAPVSALPGIKAGMSERLARLGIHTVGDMLHHYPHRYDDYSKLKPINQLVYGEETTIVGVIWETHTREARGGRPIVRSVVADASGTLEAVWFNQPYLAKELRAGRRIVLSGKVTEHLGRLTLQSPAWEPLEGELIHTGRLVPIYPLTQGVGARWLRKLMKQVVSHWAPRAEDPLPQAVRERAGLMNLSSALRNIHFPDSARAAEDARHRLSFDEFLIIQLGMLRQRQVWRGQEADPLPSDPEQVVAFLRSLPFELTGAQKRCLDSVLGDLAEPHPMSRLLQGDVGSGKTVVAAAAVLVAVAAGRQAAIMAPTEILAEQHHRTLSALLGNASATGREGGIPVALLTGSLGKAERSRVRAELASGQAQVVVGTQALIQRHVTFHNLALVVVDEQHRFGVVQRATLRGKGGAPHVLVMSATPIPRSLALTVYGDLDVSVIDELPPGRQPIETRWLLPRERERAYAFIRNQVAQGRQAFILYPLVEESDRLQVRAAVEEYERLRTTVFPDLRLGLIHGRLKGRDKDAVMGEFRDGQINILVSTSVIEVGIDVPNATVMLIEGADRFGLAQLHQFRGRVGRGEHHSFCLLLSDSASPDDPQTKATWERLKAIEQTQDGFALAEKDLELRGPGDFVGVRQSGLPELRLASLSNLLTLEQARREARLIFEDDPSLSQPEVHLLAQQVARFWHGQGDLS